MVLFIEQIGEICIQPQKTATSCTSELCLMATWVRGCRGVGASPSSGPTYRRPKGRNVYSEVSAVRLRTRGVRRLAPLLTLHVAAYDSCVGLHAQLEVWSLQFLDNVLKVGAVLYQLSPLKRCRFPWHAWADHTIISSGRDISH
jgi:hypothetical protein